jgi:hypothetical protein
MAKKEKTTIVYQEKYYKGNVINKQEGLKLISDNIDKITMEMRERTKYSDKTEEMIISIRF